MGKKFISEFNPKPQPLWTGNLSIESKKDKEEEYKDYCKEKLNNRLNGINQVLNQYINGKIDDIHMNMLLIEIYKTVFNRLPIIDWLKQNKSLTFTKTNSIGLLFIQDLVDYLTGVGNFTPEKYMRMANDNYNKPIDFIVKSDYRSLFLANDYIDIVRKFDLIGACKLIIAILSHINVGITIEYDGIDLHLKEV